MNKSTNDKFPVIRQGAGGYWHAYGKGWAVCAPTREAVKEKYNEMLEFMNELIANSIVKASDII